MRLLSLAILAAASLASAAEPAPRNQTQVDGAPTVSIGHTARIKDVFTSPDGKLALTFDGIYLRAWDVPTGKEIKNLGTYNTWYSGSTAHFVSDREWLVFCSGRIDIFDLKTLKHIKEIGRFVDTTLFTPETPNGLWADAERDHIDFGQIAEFGFPTTVLVIKSEKLQETPPICRRLIPIGPRRVVADTNYGPFVIDLETWSISSPGHTAKLGKRTSVHLQEKVPEYTFECDPADGWIAAGPKGTLLRFPPGRDGAVDEVSILSAQDLTELRKAKLAKPGIYVGAGLFNEREPSLWFISDGEYSAVNFDTLAPSTTFRPQFSFPVNSAKVAVVKGREEALVAIGNTLHKLDTHTGRSLMQFGGRVAIPNAVAAHPSRLEFTLNHGEKGKRVRFTPGGLQITTLAQDWPNFAYRPTDGRIMSTGTVMETAAGGLMPWPGKEGDVADKPICLAYSKDGTIVVGQNYRGVTAYRIASRERILNAELPQQGNRLHSGSRALAVSPDNLWLVVSDGGKNIIGFDLEHGELAWEQPADGAYNLVYFPSTKVFKVLTRQGLEIRAVDSGALKLVTEIASGVTFTDAADVSPDGRYVASTDLDFQVFDTETEEVVFQTPLQNRSWSVAFLSNPRYVLSAGVDKLVRLWDLQEKRELCVIALFSDNDDWTVTTPQLRFDGTEQGLREMYVVRDASVLPLESLFEKLYTPKLLPSLLAGEKLDVPIIDLKKLSSPPVVHLELPDGSRNLQVEDDRADHQTENETVRLRTVADAGPVKLQEIRLFQNGKLIATRASSGSTATDSLELKLIPGANTFKAIAVNEERTESLPHELTVEYKPSGAKPAESGGLRLHLLVVGVNQYKNPKYNLNYAVADATAVKKQIEEQTRAIFTGVKAKFILDTNANKAAITDAFRSMATDAGARDVFVFYYAGHGVMTAEAAPEFYLVPHDVTQLYGADDELRSRGISAKELLELSKTMPAQKQLFILDACQSAGALKTMAMRGAAEEKAIAQLARSTGTHWLTASGSEQFATEFEQLGHGAFTYVLLEGLAGKADTGDQRVTVNELKAYLESQVPEVTQKHKGTPQFPSSYGFGQDFPIVVLQ